METQRQIDTLESRQLELRAGLDFRATYPLDYEEYEAANAEYNANEKTLAELRARRAEELAAEETVMDFQNIEQ